MSKRSELEAALAKAGADWRKANDNLDKEEAERTKAHTAWDKAFNERRYAGADRRKPGSI